MAPGRLFSAAFATSLLLVSAHGLAQICPDPPPLTNPSPAACATDAKPVTAIPAKLDQPNTKYCIAQSLAGGGAGVIEIAADGVELDGAQVPVGADVKIGNVKHVTVRRLNTTGTLGMGATGTPSDVTISECRFDHGDAYVAQVFAVSGLHVADTVFRCDCPGTTAENRCVNFEPATPGNLIDDLVFERNRVESDCVKNMKLVGGVPYGTGGTVRHTLTDNVFFSKYAAAQGDEITNFTWRNAPAGNAAAERNVFSKNLLVSAGNANSIYLRDDLDNADFSDNCLDLRNPGGLPVFYGAIIPSSGNDPPATDPSGLHFERNLVYAHDAPAIYVQGYEENPTADDNRTLFRYNVLASGSASAVYHGAQTGAFWQHNTIYSGADTQPGFVFDKPTVVREVEFADNIFGCRNQKDGTRFYCFVLPGAASDYAGKNNLFFNFANPALDVYQGGAISLADWMKSGEDPGSIGKDPAFVDLAKLDFHLTEGSPARNAASDGTDVGAFQFDHGGGPGFGGSGGGAGAPSGGTAGIASGGAGTGALGGTSAGGSSAAGGSGAKATGSDDDGGCGCRSARDRTRAPFAFVLAVLAAGVGAARRRQPRRRA